MLLPTNKHGLSAVIGYVLIIAISMAMSIGVYALLKSYIPVPVEKCSEGTSIFIRNFAYICTPGAETLNITVKNNGRFDVQGYFIRVSNVSDLDASAVIDISSRIMVGGKGYIGSVIFNDLIPNYLTIGEPTNVRTTSFNVTGYGRLYKVEITPTRLQEDGNRRKVVSCGDAKIEETITCT